MRSFRLIAVTFLSFGLAGCFGPMDLLPVAKKSKGGSSSFINDKTKFSSAAYGVAASPRVSRSRTVRKGGGRRQVGKPYKIRGQWYRPREEPGYDKVGQASWYGPNFHGRLTANGEVYDQYALSAAHPTFPLPSYARVTNRANGKSVIVRVNDRGPYHDGRIIDLSARASELLDYQRKGIATVRVQYIGQAPLHGRDETYLASSYRSGGAGGSIVASTVGKIGRSVRRPSLSLAQGILLDAMPTSSITKADGADDPFTAELEKLKAGDDDGKAKTTLSLRYKSLAGISENASGR